MRAYERRRPAGGAVRRRRNGRRSPPRRLLEQRAADDDSPHAASAAASRSSTVATRFAVKVGITASSDRSPRTAPARWITTRRLDALDQHPRRPGSARSATIHVLASPGAARSAACRRARLDRAGAPPPGADQPGRTGHEDARARRQLRAARSPVVRAPAEIVVQCAGVEEPLDLTQPQVAMALEVLDVSPTASYARASSSAPRSAVHSKRQSGNADANFEKSTR